MTYYAVTMEMPPALVECYPQASSPAASLVQREMCAALADKSPSAAQVELEILDLLELGHVDAELTPVDQETVLAALGFAALLPRSLPSPEIASDPDGEVSFDWSGPAGKMFSVSVSRNGRISFAGRFGATSKIHGTEQLSEILPHEIVRGIQKVVR